jgi:hypothetical protein
VRTENGSGTISRRRCPVTRIPVAAGARGADDEIVSEGQQDGLVCVWQYRPGAWPARAAAERAAAIWRAVGEAGQ